MKEYELDLDGKAFDTEQLDAEFRQAIGADFQGISTRGRHKPVSVWIADEPVLSLDELAEIIEGVGQAHVPVAREKPKTIEERLADLEARLKVIEGKRK